MFDVAVRNLFRNVRRSTTTVASIALGGVAVVLLASFSANVTHGIQTETVGRMGHFNIYKQGFFQSGGGNTGAFGIPNYQALIEKIRTDADLAPLVRVVTPTVSLGGIASSPSADASTTFLGQGVVPGDRQKMASWNEYQLPTNPDALTEGVPANQADAGVIGAGLARILNVCDPSRSDCGGVKGVKTSAFGADPRVEQARRFADLAKDENLSDATDKATMSISLLAATSGGAPNVVRLRVASEVALGVKELNDRYVGMPLGLAQSLLFGRSEPLATAIVIQLQHSADLRRAQQHLKQLIEKEPFELELFDFTVLSPAFRQVTEFYGTLSLGLMLIFSTVALFMTMNTMSTSIHERTREIGTLRALGMERGTLRRLFLKEGVMLGMAGATLGVALAAALIYLLNHAGLTWMPPGTLRPVPMRFSFVGAVPTIVVLWLMLVASSALAARLAAGQAARMQVVDALRH
jgi:putative ABC transport system permease protein